MSTIYPECPGSDAPYRLITADVLLRHELDEEEEEDEDDDTEENDDDEESDDGYSE